MIDAGTETASIVWTVIVWISWHLHTVYSLVWWFFFSPTRAVVRVFWSSSLQTCWATTQKLSCCIRYAVHVTPQGFNPLGAAQCCSFVHENYHGVESYVTSGEQFVPAWPITQPFLPTAFLPRSSCTWCLGSSLYKDVHTGWGLKCEPVAAQTSRGSCRLCSHGSESCGCSERGITMAMFVTRIWLPEICYNKGWPCQMATRPGDHRHWWRQR